MPDVRLEGCNTEPLLSYLKALGILRVVAGDAERGDAKARAAWENGELVLRSRFGAEELVSFFENDYRPTPIVVPWSFSHFFGVNEVGNPGPFGETPTGKDVIEAVLASKTDRLADYRAVVRGVLLVMRQEAIVTKADLGEKESKARLLAAFRSRLEDSMVDWLDAAVAVENEKATFNSLLGSGGGSDGHTHFSDHFMQNIWDVLPDFDVQRTRRRTSGYLENALFGKPTANLSTRTGALFDSGAVGGPNASQGYDGDSILNPWNFILGVEGCLCFAGALTRRLKAGAGAAFPFTVLLSAAGYGTAVEKEANQREIWLPMWKRFVSLPELRQIFAEGRAQVGTRESRTGTDFARAITSYGVDAGIQSFLRFGFVKGRVGGDNYNTAVPLGLFEVEARGETQLMLEIDGWLERYRAACREAPLRFQSALERIEGTIIDYTRYGGSARVGGVLRALGNAERELAGGEKMRSDSGVRPIGPLSPAWVEACDDGSVEYGLACALASIAADRSGQPGDIRTAVEPLKAHPRGYEWTNGGANWVKGNLIQSMAELLTRRVIQSNQKSLGRTPLWGCSPARLDWISSFLWGQVDDRQIEDLFWGLVLIDRSRPWPSPQRAADTEALPLPRSYALLKLLFLSGPLIWPEGGEPVEIAPEGEILAQLRGGQMSLAGAHAVRRLRACGFAPLPITDWLDPGIRADRLAAVLAFPVGQTRALADLVFRKSKEVKA